MDELSIAEARAAVRAVYPNAVALPAWARLRRGPPDWYIAKSFDQYATIVVAWHATEEQAWNAAAQLLAQKIAGGSP